MEVQSEDPGIFVIGGRSEKDATGIARPPAIGAPAMKTNFVGERIRFFEHRARAIFPAQIVDDQVHTLMPCQRADDLGIDPLDRFEFPRPVGAEVRPGEPGGYVWLPLGGHAVSLCGGEKFGTRSGLLAGYSFCHFRPVIFRPACGW